jgi:hypothetical protein
MKARFQLAINQDYGTESLYFSSAKAIVQTLHRRNLAWLPPCSVSMYRGTGNLNNKNFQKSSIITLNGTKANLKLNYRCIDESSLDLNVPQILSFRKKPIGTLDSS